MKKEIKGTRVTIKDTGLAFNLGQEIRPSWDDVRIAMRRIWVMDYGTKVLPENVTDTVLVSGNREQINSLVVSVLRGIEELLARGGIPLEDERQIVVAAYILAWYWHMELGGPRPVTEGPTVRKRPVYIGPVNFVCPLCGKHFHPPSHFKAGSAKFKAWVEWLTRHGEEYHKFDKTYQIRPHLLTGTSEKGGD